MAVVVDMAMHIHSDLLVRRGDRQYIIEIKSSTPGSSSCPD
jgi:hypothetical protein